MKRIYLLSILFVVVITSFGKKSGSFARVVNVNGNKVINCNMSEVKDTIDLLLSDIVEDCEFIPLETNLKSLFKSVYHIGISDNYLAIHSYGTMPIKLFKRNGEFVRDIGSVGNGPGEFTSLYGVQLNEIENKVYLTPFANANKLFVYSFDNKYLTDIPLTYKQTKCHAYVENNKVTVLSMPFKNMGDEPIPIAYQQTLDGKLIQEVKASEAQLIDPRNEQGQFVGFNNEISSSNNSGDYDLFIMRWGGQAYDTLYHYNVQKNELQPQFVASFNGKKEGSWTREWKNHYWTVVFGDKFKGANVIVDKKTLKSNFFRLKNDFYGNIRMDRYFMSNNGWLVCSVPAIDLIAQIDAALKGKDLNNAEKTKLKNMLTKIDQNSNDVLFIGRMK
jgi:hypothetical protein